MSLYSVFAIFVIEKDVKNYPRVFAYDDANHIVTSPSILSFLERNRDKEVSFFSEIVAGCNSVAYSVIANLPIQPFV